MTSASITVSDHVPGRTFEEQQGLRWPARVGRNASTTRLDRVSLATGRRCLGVGCGPDETMRPMTKRVGAADANASRADHSLRWPLLMGVHKRRMGTGR